MTIASTPPLKMYKRHADERGRTTGGGPQNR